MKKRGRAAGRLLIIFFAVMVFLTFFSKTINNFCLPIVRSEYCSRGYLIKEVTGEGTVNPREVAELYTELRRRVKEINVEPGDEVRKGNIIVILDALDFTDAVEKELANYRKGGISLEEMFDRIAESNLNTFEQNIDIANFEVESTKQKLESEKMFLKTGSATQTSVREAEKNYAEALHNYDLKVEARDQRFRDNLKDIKNIILVSPVQGAIEEVNYNLGSFTGSNQPVVTITNISTGFIFSVIVTKESADYLQIGEEIEVRLFTGSSKNIEGMLSAKKKRSGQENIELIIDLVIDLADTETVTGGERGEIYVAKKTAFYNTLVLNSAIGSSSEGDFVWVLKERKGPLGKEFFSIQAPVTIADNDNSRTAISSGLESHERVIIWSNKPLTHGGKVAVE